MKRGKALDLKTRIQRRIAAQTGAVWTPIDFLDLGPRAAVDKALQRLAGSGDVSRIDRGLYFRPRRSGLTGDATNPHQKAVIDAVARRDQTRVVVDGLTAANDLGLTTAVPARVIVLTDARLRPIQLGNQHIQFKTVAPSRLYWAGRPAMRVVQALYWLQDMLQSDPSRLMKRLSVLFDSPKDGPGIRDDLRKGIHALPIWMQTIDGSACADIHLICGRQLPPNSLGVNRGVELCVFVDIRAGASASPATDIGASKCVLLELIRG